MDHNISLAGFCIFLISFGLLGAAFVYWAVRARRLASCSTKTGNYSVTWANTLWIYLTFLSALLLLAFLYMAQYLDQGFAIKPSLLIVIWLRWVLLAVSGGFIMGTLIYVVTPHQFSGQSFFGIFYYIVAILFLLGATLSQSQGTRLLWYCASIIAAVASLFLVFFPLNKMGSGDLAEARAYARESQNSSDKKLRRAAAVTVIAYTYRYILLAQLVIAYLAYVIIWALNDANELSSAIGLNSALTAYLVFDCLAILPFALYLVVLSFANLTRSVILEDKESGHLTFLSAAAHHNSQLGSAFAADD